MLHVSKRALTHLLVLVLQLEPFFANRIVARTQPNERLLAASNIFFVHCWLIAVFVELRVVFRCMVYDLSSIWGTRYNRKHISQKSLDSLRVISAGNRLPSCIKQEFSMHNCLCIIFRDLISDGVARRAKITTECKNSWWLKCIIATRFSPDAVSKLCQEPKRRNRSAASMRRKARSPLAHTTTTAEGLGSSAAEQHP